MTVAETFTLPAQPTTGTARFIPLAGSGVLGPLGYYQIAVTLDDLASTGYNKIRCILDKRYTHIVSHCGVTKIQASVANAVWSLKVSPSQQWIVDLVGYDDLTSADPQIADVRTPNLEIIDGDGSAYIESLIEENAIGDTHGFTAVIYVFNKNIRNMVPLHIILGSLGGR